MVLKKLAKIGGYVPLKTNCQWHVLGNTFYLPQRFDGGTKQEDCKQWLSMTWKKEMPLSVTHYPRHWFVYNIFIMFILYIQVIFVLRIALLEKENHRLIDEYENVVHDIRQKSDRAFDELKKERDNTTAKVGFSSCYYLFIYLFIYLFYILKPL